MKVTGIPRRVLGVVADFVRDEPFLVGSAATAAAEYGATQLSQYGIHGVVAGWIQAAVLGAGLYLVRNFVTPANSIEDKVAKALEQLVPVRVGVPAGTPVPAPTPPRVLPAEPVPAPAVPLVAPPVADPFESPA